MDSKEFDRLAESVRQMKAIVRGDIQPARVTEVDVPDVARLRRRIGASQREFAALFGISVRTLQDWEQGRRTPEGPARVLLKVCAHDPAAVIRAVHPDLRFAAGPTAAESGTNTGPA